jgi:hypothetical protein
MGNSKKNLNVVFGRTLARLRPEVSSLSGIVPNKASCSGFHPFLAQRPVSL